MEDERNAEQAHVVSSSGAGYVPPAIRELGSLTDLTAGNASGVGFDASFSTDPCHGLTSMPMHFP